MKDLHFGNPERKIVKDNFKKAFRSAPTSLMALAIKQTLILPKYCFFRDKSCGS